MAFIKLDAAGVVLQKQPYSEEGFIEAPDYVVAGMVRQEDGSYSAPESPEAPRPVPQVVSRAKGKAALVIRGHWDAVAAFVDAIPDPMQKALAEIALYDTGDWQRDSPFLQTAAGVIGLDDEGLDELFTFADSISL